MKTVKSQRNEARLFNPPQKSTEMIHVAKVNQSWDDDQLDTLQEQFENDIGTMSNF